MPQTDPQLLAHARLMRADMPQPERKLWSELRAKRFQSTKFARQVVIGSYIGDFVCRSRKLIIEIDGHSHADPTADERRTLDLEVLE